MQQLKIDTTPFDDLESGAKSCEVRRCDDRVFKVGETLRICEYVDGEFTGRFMYRRVTHIQTGYGLPEGICVLSYGV